MDPKLEKEIDQIVKFYSEKGMEKALKAALVGLVNKTKK